ncbi:hypothetical protein DOK_10697 [gamma proteobacterium BDW918]|uniref:SMODS and SLOG-associating 2TM effector domain-containing protein n=1 Tax=Zhongshania aliphaticivorans TaxID=1470434 RepID=A0A127M5F8_9GAMM|nr:SLATT domain-containing protein [Zhongshania aliphaticivorans]AMO68447.1 hypothetical protein AZF00_09095 [Zhongshania aliphaticivorans]EIF42989.1 hypothetical protein DOK_10697 [gamma proteobacterium BDW918]
MAFSDNIWWTRKSKIQAEKRLVSNAFQAQVVLLWYSFAGVAASVYYLKYSSSDGDMSGIAWVVYSVLVLCMSGFINGLSFKQRAGLIKECYETLNDVYQRCREFEAGKTPCVTLEELSAEYDQILGVCENHLTIDYYLAQCEAYLTTPKENRKNLDKKPTPYIWICTAWHITKRCLMMAFFYLLPVLVFILLECMA